jgi:hypothetical protein
LKVLASWSAASAFALVLAAGCGLAETGEAPPAAATDDGASTGTGSGAVGDDGSGSASSSGGSFSVSDDASGSASDTSVPGAHDARADAHLAADGAPQDAGPLDAMDPCSKLGPCCALIGAYTDASGCAAAAASSSAAVCGYYLTGIQSAGICL